MIWLLFALIGALFDSLYSATGKKLLRNSNVFLVGSGASFSSSLVLFIVSYVVGFPVITDPMFMYYVIGSAFLDMITISLFLKAIKESDISLVLPFSSFTLVFLIAIAFIVLGELPTLGGITGILLIFVGSYIINLKAGLDLKPFKEITKHRGIMYMLLFSVTGAIVITINKLFLLSSDQFFGPAINSFFIGLFFFIAALVSGEKVLKHYRKFKGKLFLMGLINAIMRMFLGSAYLIQIAPYVISVKRSSIIFGVIWGRIFFKEKSTIYRLWGAIIMLVGIILIALF